MKCLLPKWFSIKVIKGIDVDEICIDNITVNEMIVELSMKSLSEEKNVNEIIVEERNVDEVIVQRKNCR